MTWQAVTSIDDPNFELIIQALPWVRLLKTDESVKPAELAFFTCTDCEFNSHGGYYLATASFAIMDDQTPVWAQRTSFRVAIISTMDRPRRGVVKATNKIVIRSLKAIYEAYSNWEPGNKTHEVPWGAKPKNPDDLKKYCNWKNKAWKERGLTIGVD